MDSNRQSPPASLVVEWWDVCTSKQEDVGSNPSQIPSEYFFPKGSGNTWYTVLICQEGQYLQSFLTINTHWSGPPWEDHMLKQATLGRPHMFRQAAFGRPHMFRQATLGRPHMLRWAILGRPYMLRWATLGRPHMFRLATLGRPHLLGLDLNPRLPVQMSGHSTAELASGDWRFKFM